MVRGSPPPTNNFRKTVSYSNKFIYRRKGNLSESQNQLKYRKNIMISQFCERFPFMEVRKNFRLLKRKHIICHFEALDLEISNIQFVSRNVLISPRLNFTGMSNNEFRKIGKCFRKTAKFESFAKQVIYLESSDHVVMHNMFIF